MNTKEWIFVFVGMGLVIIPEPATTGTGLAILAALAGVRALEGEG